MCKKCIYFCIHICKSVQICKCVPLTGVAKGQLSCKPFPKPMMRRQISASRVIELMGFTRRCRCRTDASYWLSDHEDRGEFGGGREQDKERSRKEKKSYALAAAQLYPSVRSYTKPISAVSWAALIGSSCTGLKWKWSCSVGPFVHTQTAF